MGTKRCSKMVMLVLLCVVLAGGWSPAWARTIYVDDDAAGAQDGTSWASAFRTLQDALAVASDEDEIRVAQGAYAPDRGGGNTAGDRNATFRVPDGVTIKGGFAGVGAPDSNLRDIALFATVLTGDLAGNDDPNHPSTLSDNSLHVVTAQAVENDTLLDGLTIAHGNAADGAGGGLCNSAATYTVRDCTFFRNRADRGGGGVVNTDSYTLFVGCTFLENECDDGEGGGMMNQRSYILIESCRFIRNYADDDGGGLCNFDRWLEVINCEFLENSASECGGGASAGRASFFNCVFRANTSGEGAGAISGGTLRLNLCRFVDNVGWESVGGVACGDMMAANCTFANNSGEQAGAILATSGYLSLKHCTFWGNTATLEPAGGIDCRPDCSLTANSCIFWANRGGLDDRKENPLTTYDAQISGDPNLVTVEYCCIEGWTPVRGGRSNISEDPLFVAPDQNDFHLKSQAGHWDHASLAWVLDDITSPCIDAGDPKSPIDQEPFPNGGHVNLGAYGGTSEASKSWFGTEPNATINAADLNGDGRVDYEDYRLAFQRWPQTDQ